VAVAVLPECTVHPADITVLLEVREVVHLDTPMPLLAVQEIPQAHLLRGGTLLLRWRIKDLLAGQILLLVLVMQLLAVAVVQAGRVALRQELLSPAVVKLGVSVKHLLLQGLP
jgi:hypothetical protein